MQRPHTKSKTAPAPCTRNPGPRWARGFTLIELLVVIAIIALLVSILLPALGSARDTARTLVCSSTIRQMAMAQLTYTNDWKEWLAGSPGTSGWSLLPPGGAGSPTNPPPYVKSTAQIFDGQSVQIWDNHGPLLNYLNLQAGNEGQTITGNGDVQRFQRWEYIRSAPQINCLNNVADRLDSYDNIGPRGKVNSYFMSTQFTSTEKAPPFGTNTRPQNRNSYQPQLYRVGSGSIKALFYEGARFTLEDRGVWTISVDMTPAANFGGTFSDTGPWFSSNQSFNRNKNINGLRAVKLAARHGGNKPNSAAIANVSFFDGHVETVDDLGMTNPDYWFPTGTRFTAALDTWSDTRTRWPNKVAAGAVSP